MVVGPAILGRPAGGRVPVVYPVSAGHHVGQLHRDGDRGRGWIEHAIGTDGVAAKQIDDGLLVVAAGEQMGSTVGSDRARQRPAAKTNPVDQRKKIGQRPLGEAHPDRELVRMTIGPPHPATRPAGRQVRPLDVTEILVIEPRGECDAVIFEGVDRPVLAVEEGAAVGDLGQRLTHEAPGADRGGDRVRREVDGAFLVEVAAGEIECRMAEDGFVQPRLPHQLRPEHRGSLEVGMAMDIALDRAQPRADVADETLEAVGSVLALNGVQLIPQVPGKDYAVAAPTARGEFQPTLDERTGRCAGEQALAAGAGPTIDPVVRVRVPIVPGEERVERRQQQAQSDPAAHRHELVESGHHELVEGPGGVLQQRAAVLAILQHQSERR